MKKVLFIDFDGTLCHDRFWRSAEPGLHARIQDVLFKKGKERVGLWMKGSYSSEEINQWLADVLSTDFEKLWRLFVDDCESMFIEPGVLEQIQKLLSTYALVLVTDNMDCFDRFTVPALSLDHYFDRIINSSREGASKNENGGALFQRLMAEFGVKASQTMLMDNSRNTCEIFKTLGGEARFVSETETLSDWLSLL